MNGISNKENLWPFGRLFDQPRTWCWASQKEGTKLRFSQAHSSFRHNPVSLGDKVTKVQVARGVPFGTVETVLLCFDFRVVTTRADCRVLQKSLVASPFRP